MIDILCLVYSNLWVQKISLQQSMHSITKFAFVTILDLIIIIQEWRIQFFYLISKLRLLFKITLIQGEENPDIRLFLNIMRLWKDLAQPQESQVFLLIKSFILLLFFLLKILKINEESSFYFYYKYFIYFCFIYKLEQPFRIQDSYARPQADNQSINQDDQTFISI